MKKTLHSDINKDMNEHAGFSETKRLLSRVKEGDQNALNILFEQYYHKVHLLARLKLGKKLRSKLDSMDIVQDAMFSALKGLEEIEVEKEGDFLNWLYKIVENNIKEKARFYNAKKRSLDKEIPPSDTGKARILADSNQSPSKILIRNENFEALCSGLELLPDKDREIILLHSIYEYSFPEIASLTNKTEDACRMHFNRAMFKLTTKIKI